MGWRQDADSRKHAKNGKQADYRFQVRKKKTATHRKQKWSADRGHAAPVTRELEHKDPFPDDPGPSAFQGILGELVKTIEPHTEASTPAILLQTLACFGNVIGRGPHFLCENTRHHTTLFCVVVGKTGRSRKGTSWDYVLSLFTRIDPKWATGHLGVGLSSGEGLVYHARDPESTLLGINKTDAISGQAVPTVPLEATDKRLLVVETEFASVLKNAERQGNNLSAVIRQAWDGHDLRSMAKNNPGMCTKPHVGIIGHITMEELRRYLTNTESANGFANRFLWAAIRRTKYLPEGGGGVDLTPFVAPIHEAITFARHVGELKRDRQARELWIHEYPRLSADRPGMLGALTARAEAYTMRLACLYALLDRSCMIELTHLEAALAIWDFCERSTSYLFGQSTGDTVADEILAALKTSKAGLSRYDIYLLFSKNQSKERISRALLVLDNASLAHCVTVKTDGRPKEVWMFGKTS